MLAKVFTGSTIQLDVQSIGQRSLLEHMFCTHIPDPLSTLVGCSTVNNPMKFAIYLSVGFSCGGGGGGVWSQSLNS